MILCCGEALIDMLPRRTEAGEPAFSPHTGGSVFNTAIALGRLGAPAAFWCGLSSDAFGEMLRADLAASGVDISLCPISDRPTTLAFVTLTDGQARYMFYDENTAARLVGVESLPNPPAEAQALFFGGISLVVEPSGGAHEAHMLREAPRRVVMMDPNIRPGFIRDETAFRSRLSRMMKVADIIKLSDEDLAWLTGAGAPEDYARRLLDDGASLVVVTQGEAGATAYAEGRECRIAPPAVEVVDTVGAGDSFNAGLLHALLEEGLLDKAAIRAIGPDPLRRVLTHAARVAAVTVSRAGANPPWRSEIAAQ